MNQSLFVNALLKYSIGVVVVGLLIFLPAGTLHFEGGILLMAILFVPMFLAGIVLLKKDPDLLRKRLDVKEKQKEQKDVVKYSGLLFLASFILSGLSFRFRWLQLPRTARIIAAILFLVAYALYGEVLRENTFLSRTIEVQEGQHVIDTGMYGIVRHPMYAVTILLFLMMPLVLGSVLGFAVMLLYLPIIQKRMINEEIVLKEGLPGYTEYMNKVRYRVIPYIW